MKPAHRMCKEKDTDLARPWILLVYPWGVDQPKVTEHFCEEDAVEEATRSLMENRRQTAYIGPMTKVMGVKKTRSAMHVVIDDTSTGIDAWQDHFASTWPGTEPNARARTLSD